ncbi:MAG: D-alanyl-D-alanine carboxypeptidase/D-alanyl-D-alanine-endopeptidase [Phycisphaerales bacterium]|jgi:D-alanyl-D-alanine carboxypeptidase/D-alanyl-D-alanine-endopeptidase (penicillin-binding protein 4)
MTKVWAWSFGLATLIAGVALGQPNALTADAGRAVALRKLGNAKVAICVRDCETGAMLAGVNESTPMTPASNMKLLTSGAALMVLTPDFVFRTEFVLDGETLIVRGDGDPALSDPLVLDRMNPKMTVGDVMTVISGAITGAGVKDLRQIIVDDRVFDRQFVHPTWPVEKLDKGYSAEVAGVNFHANVLAAFPKPSPDGPGTPPLYDLQPEAPWLRIENRARTIVQGKNAVWLTRDADANQFTMHGEVRFPVSVGVEVTVHNPPDFFGRVLASKLMTSGITMTGSGDLGNAQSVRVVNDADSFGTGRVLAVVSTPIAEVLRRCNTDSENLYAESLFKRMGHAVTKEPGSWTNGAAVLRMVLTQKLGAEAAASVTISDGSGLSRDDAVSPLVMTRWLEAISKDKSIGDLFVASLAVPGEGTLKSRFLGDKVKNEVHAKSGFINGVRTLSGYVESPTTGRRVAFSVMVNNVNGADSQAKELHEDIVKLADKWLADRERGAKLGG